MEKIVLDDLHIDEDDTALRLADALANNTSLKVLHLLGHLEHYDGPLLTSSWQAIFECLKSPYSRLESIKLDMTYLADDILISLSGCLDWATTLRDLVLEGDMDYNDTNTLKG